MHEITDALRAIPPIAWLAAVVVLGWAFVGAAALNGGQIEMTVGKFHFKTEIYDE